MLPRHTVSAPLLWQLLCQWLAGASVKAAAQSLPRLFALETAYHLLARLRQRLDAVRTRLSRELKAPASGQSDPLLQTVEHLQLVFAGQPCPVARFQVCFQHPFLR